MDLLGERWARFSSGSWYCQVKNCRYPRKSHIFHLSQPSKELLQRIPEPVPCFSLFVVLRMTISFYFFHSNSEVWPNRETHDLFHLLNASWLNYSKWSSIFINIDEAHLSLLISWLSILFHYFMFSGNSLPSDFRWLRVVWIKNKYANTIVCEVPSSKNFVYCSHPFG